MKDNSRRLKFWRVPRLDNLELLHATNITHDYPPHMHEEYCIVLVLHGTEITTCRGTSYKALPGNLFFVNAEEVHSSKSIRSEYRVMKITPGALSRLCIGLIGRALETPCFTKSIIKDTSIFRLLLRLHLKLEQNVPALEQESEFLSALGLLMNRQNKTDFIPPPARKELHSVHLVQDYLKTHYAENVSLAQLTSITNLNPFYLLRAFRNQVGVPPHEYQTQVRITHARKLIRYGKSISEVAQETGFFDQSHLSRNFKRITGMTPGQYLSQIKIVQDTTE
jgi:AraC-like DNA-binding protein